MSFLIFSVERRMKHILKYSLILNANACLRSYSVCSLTSNKTLEKQHTFDKYSQYYFEDGFRKVYPFYYQHDVYCKTRWIERKLIDVYCEEFGLYRKEDYEKRILKGLITVNNMHVNVDYVLKHKDLITAVVHKHELPVLACPIKVLFENDELFVVDKPPSIPVHPSGRYNYNSILNILANDYNIRDLYNTHRLDRLTSGVLIFVKSSAKSREFYDQMNLRSISKEYICRVEGNFPDGTVICNKPIKKCHHKLGISLVDVTGKISISEFKKLSYNGKSSIVLCKPHTGRTHQIRVHLQFLGYPILNDPIYNNNIFGPNKGKNGIIDKPISQLQDELLAEHLCEWGFQTSDCEHKTPSVVENLLLHWSMYKKYYKMNEEFSHYKKDPSKVVYDENCYFCDLPNQDPQLNRLGIFLHAYKYQGRDWEFQADMPFWASEDWND